MPLDPEAAKAMRAASLDAAAAFLEDFDRIQRLIAHTQRNREDARHISGILRRWLLDGDLQTIASPRIGRTEIVTTDFRDAYAQTAIQKPISFYAADILDTQGRPVWVIVGNEKYQITTDKSVTLTLDQYRDQCVLFFEGTWLSRRELIRYVANEKSGVHSGNEHTIENKHLIARLEVAMTVRGSAAQVVEFKFEQPPMVAPKSTYKRGAMNPVLIYMYLSAIPLVRSPDMIRLADFIRRELD